MDKIDYTANEVLLGLLGVVPNPKVKDLKKGKNGSVNIKKDFQGDVIKIQEGKTTFNIKYITNPFQKKEIAEVNNIPVDKFHENNLSYSSPKWYIRLGQ